MKMPSASAGTRRHGRGSGSGIWRFSRRRAGIALLAMAVLLPGHAAAVVTSDTTDACNPEAFILADGHREVPADRLFPADWPSAEVFPHRDPALATAPDGELDAPTRAMLLVETLEPAVERARWELRVRLLAGSREEPGINACSVVELRRYNLTRAVHARLRRNDPEAAPGGPGPQAVHPHVSWRFWMTTTMGMRADVILAARRTLDDVEATRARCLGQPCLAPDAQYALLEEPGITEWQPRSAPPPARYRANWPADAAPGLGLSSPARVVEEMFYRGPDGDPEMPTFRDDPARPRFTLLLDRNVEGQEDSLIGTLREIDILDDAVAEMWLHRIEVRGIDGQPEVVWQRRPVCRRSAAPPCP